MKKIFAFFLLGLVFFSPSFALAADKYYCDCSAEFPALKAGDGTKCEEFSAIADLEKPESCPIKCVRIGPVNTPPDSCVQNTDNTNTSLPVSADSGKTVKLTNPLVGGETDIVAIVGLVIKGALGIMGALVLLMIVWGGTTWLTAAGNPEKVKAGSNTIIWAVLGAVVALGSYVLLNTVLKALAG